MDNGISDKGRGGSQGGRRLVKTQNHLFSKRTWEPFSVSDSSAKMGQVYRWERRGLSVRGHLPVFQVSISVDPLAVIHELWPWILTDRVYYLILDFLPFSPPWPPISGMIPCHANPGSDYPVSKEICLSFTNLTCQGRVVSHREPSPVVLTPLWSTPNVSRDLVRYSPRSNSIGVGSGPESEISTGDPKPWRKDQSVSIDSIFSPIILLFVARCGLLLNRNKSRTQCGPSLVLLVVCVCCVSEKRKKEERD